MNQALAGLVAAAPTRKAQAVSNAAADVAMAALDLQMQYRPIPEIDADRLQLWARRIRVDAGDDDLAGVRSDVAVLNLVWDRVRPTADQAKATDVDGRLAGLRDQAGSKDVEGALVPPRAAGRQRCPLAALQRGQPRGVGQREALELLAAVQRAAQLGQARRRGLPAARPARCRGRCAAPSSSAAAFPRCRSGR